MSGGSIISKDAHKNIWYHEWGEFDDRICVSVKPYNEIITERNYNICIQGAFVHFQSWKRNYFLFTVSAMEYSGAHALDGVLSEFGFIVTQHNHHSKIHRKERNSCISFYSSFGNCEEFVSFHSMSLVTDSTLDHEELTIIAISTLDRSYGIFSSIVKLKDVEIVSKIKSIDFVQLFFLIFYVDSCATDRFKKHFAELSTGFGASASNCYDQPSKVIRV